MDSDKPNDMLTSNANLPHPSPTPQSQKQEQKWAEISVGEYAGRFHRLPTLLGRGANKEVYLAFDTAKTRDVAWNRVPKKDLTRQDQNDFQKEIEMMRRAEHDHIIKYWAFWEDSNYFTFITEYFNMNLKEYIHSRAIQINSVKRWAKQILEGLSHLHAAGIIHRDIKCDNIFINQKSGDIVIGDLGLSRNFETGGRSMSMVGTVPFMAPEQLHLENRVYDCKVDIYALGMTVLEMVTGEYPYGEIANLALIIRNIMDEKVPVALMNLKESPTKKFIKLCLTWDADKRPGANELLLNPWLTDETDNDVEAASLVTAEVPKVPRQDTPSGIVKGITPLNPRVGALTTSPPVINAISPTADDVSVIETPPEVEETREETETERVEEENQDEQFRQHIQTLKNMTEQFAEAETYKNLPAELIEGMNDVDMIVKTFVQNQVPEVREEFDVLAANLHQEYHLKRKKLDEWVESKHQELKESSERQKELQTKEKKLSGQITQNEKETNSIREKLNLNVEERTQKATLIKEKKARMEELRKEMQELEEESAQIETELNELKGKCSEQTQTALSNDESREKLENDLQETRKELELLSNNESFVHGKAQIEQFDAWRSRSQAAMEEIERTREIDWRDWGPEQIVRWICRLDDGEFEVYRKILEEKAEDLLGNGDDLAFLDIPSLGELGIKRIRHRQLLLRHVERLQQRDQKSSLGKTKH